MQGPDRCPPHGPKPHAGSQAGASPATPNRPLMPGARVGRIASARSLPAANALRPRHIATIKKGCGLFASDDEKTLSEGGLVDLMASRALRPRKCSIGRL